MAAVPVAPLTNISLTMRDAESGKVRTSSTQFFIHFILFELNPFTPAALEQRRRLV
jgi:hypothetical protein